MKTASLYGSCWPSWFHRRMYSLFTQGPQSAYHIGRKMVLHTFCCGRKLHVSLDRNQYLFLCSGPQTGNCRDKVHKNNTFNWTITLVHKKGKNRADAIRVSFCNQKSKGYQIVITVYHWGKNHYGPFIDNYSTFQRSCDWYPLTVPILVSIESFIQGWGVCDSFLRET